jgi:LacI family transcriptional regulator
MAGFKRGLSEFDLELDSELTIEAGYTFESGVRATDNLLSRKERPTAIFTGNDEMAMGVYTSVRNAGLNIPDDISVVSFDDTPMAGRVSPPLTSVRLPIREMGQEAAKGILRLVSEQGNKTNQSFKPEIVIRHSTRRINNS